MLNRSIGAIKIIIGAKHVFEMGDFMHERQKLTISISYFSSVWISFISAQTTKFCCDHNSLVSDIHWANRCRGLRINY